MDSTPPEVWERIFEWACRDSGYIGRALGQVSSDFRAVSRRYAYQSIHIPTFHNLLAFKTHLLSLPVDHRRVKFLHTPCPHIFRDQTTPAYYEDEMDLDEDVSDSDSDESARLEMDERQQCAEFRGLITQLSPSLLVLSVFWHSNFPVLWEDLLPADLPVLQELHLRRTFVDLARDNNPPTAPLPTFQYPKLRCLYITGYDERRETNDREIPFHAVLRTIAPNLTHLHVPIFHMRSSNRIALSDNIESVVIDLGFTNFYQPAMNIIPATYSEASTMLFGSSEVPQGKSVRLIIDECSEARDTIEHWEDRWESYANGSGRTGPWLIW